MIKQGAIQICKDYKLGLFGIKPYWLGSIQFFNTLIFIQMQTPISLIRQGGQAVITQALVMLHKTFQVLVR